MERGMAMNGKSKIALKLITVALILIIFQEVVFANEKTVKARTSGGNTINNFINDIIMLLSPEISESLLKKYDCINRGSQFVVSDRYWQTSRVDKRSFYDYIQKLKFDNNGISCSDASDIIRNVIEIGNSPSYYDPLGDGIKKNLQEFLKYEISNKMIIKYDGYEQASFKDSFDQLFVLTKYKVSDKYPRLVLIAANLFSYIWVNNGKMIGTEKVAYVREPFHIEFNNSASNNKAETCNPPKVKQNIYSQKNNRNITGNNNQIGDGSDVIGGSSSDSYGNSQIGKSNQSGGGVDIIGSSSRGPVSYTQIGNTTFGSDGTSYTRIGSSTFGSDGTSYTRIGNTTFGSNGTSYSRIGSTTFGSDGTSYTRIGNSTFGSDGSSCNKIGSFTFCN
jgi:hypothetical protein